MRETYGFHMDYLRRVVPRDGLVLYSVKEGWGPLCEIPGVEVSDEPFPRANDGKVIEAFFRRKVVEGLWRWAWVGGVMVVVVGVPVYSLVS